MNSLFKKVSRLPIITTLMIILIICLIHLKYSNDKQITLSKMTEKKAKKVNPVKEGLQNKVQSKENEVTVLDFEAKVSKKEKSANESYMKNLFKERLEHLNIACNNHSRKSLMYRPYKYFFFKYDIALCLIGKVNI